MSALSSMGAFLGRQIQVGDVVLDVVLGLAALWLALLAAAHVQPPRFRRWNLRLRRFAFEVGLLLCLEQAYEFVRGAIPHESDVALLNGYRLFDIEFTHGLFIESRVERFFLHFQDIMNAVDVFYVVAHVVATLGVIAWVYLYRRHQYPFVRNLLMLTTGIALVSFYVYPTAPPRMFSILGFVDPLQLHHLVHAGGEQPSSYTYNPYAAMPSLHVGYAIIAGIAVFRGSKRIVLRGAAIVYPLVMSAVVIISGNHWLMDVVGAFLTVGIATLTLGGATWIRSRSHVPWDILRLRLLPTTLASESADAA